MRMQCWHLAWYRFSVTLKMAFELWEQLVGVSKDRSGMLCGVITSTLGRLPGVRRTGACQTRLAAVKPERLVGLVMSCNG